MNLVWSGLGVLLWSQAAPADKIAGACLLAAQLLHAQTFTAQSLPMLLIVGGFPAVTLIVSTAIANGFSALERILIVSASLIHKILSFNCCWISTGASGSIFSMTCIAI